MGHLADSNVLIDYVAERFTALQLISLDAIFDVELNVSVITQIEALGFNSPPKEEKSLLQFFSVANIFALTEDVVKQTIVLRKLYKLKTPDAIVAATAIVHKHILITHNVRDFNKIAGLNILDPYSL